MNYIKLYIESLSLEKYGRGKEFLGIIGDLLVKKEVAGMIFLRHHMRVNRLQHLLSVSYLSYLKAKKLGLNYKDTARAAMLHDLFYYDYKDKANYPKKHNRVHPALSLSNAQKIIPLTDVETDIIKSHMWPLFGEKPKTAEGLIVCRMDKVCSVLECIYSVFSGSKRIRRKASTDNCADNNINIIESDGKLPKNEVNISAVTKTGTIDETEKQEQKNADIEGDGNP